jgi:uncharacterized membrane protein
MPAATPSGVFGVALLLTVLCAALVIFCRRAMSPEADGVSAEVRRPPTTSLRGIEWLPACALAGAALLEYLWDARHPLTAFRDPAFAWFIGFYFFHAAFPFVFRRRFADTTGPWAIAALSGVIHFPLIHRLVERIAPNDLMGVVPALFAVAPAASLFVLLRPLPIRAPARLNQVAWFGGVTLLFLTLIVPIQFERQWITLGWALEGAALIWLYRRVPHPGLRNTGLVLLLIAFARLALNPAVLEYHARSTTPLFNWYLYSYGIAAGCLFMAARWWQEAVGSSDAGAATPPAAQERVFGISIQALLVSLGTILAFLLVNLEIADYFSSPGARVLTFQFSGNFARDMTYTIAWALFALVLLLAGIWRRSRAARFAALGLLGFAVLKLFVHDLARLGALYRIGALFGVAIVAIVASLAYQRWVPDNPSKQTRS